MNNINIPFIPINVLVLDGVILKIKYKKYYEVTKGVTCSEYSFEGDESKDLAVVQIEAGYKTPLQLVKEGTKTLEISAEGKGRLFVKRPNGEVNIYVFSGAEKVKFKKKYKEVNTDFTATIEVGDIMQWQADTKSSLTFVEVCKPAYQDGRFETIETGDERYFDFLEG